MKKAFKKQASADPEIKEVAVWGLVNHEGQLYARMQFFYDRHDQVARNILCTAEDLQDFYLYQKDVFDKAGLKVIHDAFVALNIAAIENGAMSAPRDAKLQIKPSTRAARMAKNVANSLNPHAVYNLAS